MQITTVIVFLIGYCIFFVLNRKNIIDNSQRLIDENGGFTSKPNQLLNFHFTAIIILGIISIIVYKQSLLQLLINIQNIGINQLLLYILTLSLTLIIAIKQSKKLYLSNKKPKTKLHLSLHFFISYFPIRALFLFVYEYWIRGILLFETANYSGNFLAIVLNVFLYVLLHLFNSKKELLACIPFGIITCLFCFLFHAVWPAILLHIAFSLSYEINFYRLNLIHLKTTKS